MKTVIYNILNTFSNVSLIIGLLFVGSFYLPYFQQSLLCQDQPYYRLFLFTLIINSKFLFCLASTAFSFLLQSRRLFIFLRNPLRICSRSRSGLGLWVMEFPHSRKLHTWLELLLDLLFKIKDITYQLYFGLFNQK